MVALRLFPFLLLIITGAATCANLAEFGTLVPPTVDQDSRLPSLAIKVAGKTRKIHVLEWGKGKSQVLFLLHGSYSDTRPYVNIAAELGQKYHVVLWAQRGCGLSERITEAEFGFEAALEEIIQVKEAYSPSQPVTLIGHSWGGGLAAFFTSRYPQSVRQLVLLEPMPLKGSQMNEIFFTIIDFSYFNPGWNQMARQSAGIGVLNHETLDYRAMLMLRSGMTRYHCDNKNPPAWPIWRVGGYAEILRNRLLGDPISGFKWDFTVGLSQYTTPVLIVGGECGALGYEVQKKYTEPLLRNATTIRINRAGHRLNVDNFAGLMAGLRQYLQEYP